MCGIALILSQSEDHIDNRFGNTAGVDYNSGKLVNTIDSANDEHTAENDKVKDEFTLALLPLLERRGPDNTNILTINKHNSKIVFIGSVLFVQGETITEQPYISYSSRGGKSYRESVLLWNGEVFNEDGIPNHSYGDNDTIAISKLLNTACYHAMEALNNTQDNKDDQAAFIGRYIANALKVVNGPYSFIYWHCHSSLVFFGRDPFGRRSLLMCTYTDDSSTNSSDASCPPYLHCICSVQAPAAEQWDSDGNHEARAYEWVEVDVKGIYYLNFSTDCYDNTNSLPVGVGCVQWPDDRLHLYRRNIITDHAAIEASSISNPSTSLAALLTSAIKRRINFLRDLNDSSSEVPQCRVGVLFSGGIDSVLLAALLHLSLLSSDRMREPIELINVTFLKSMESSNSTPSPDRLAAIAALVELKELFPQREWRLVHVDVSSEERASQENRIKDLIKPRNTHMDLNIGTAFWFASQGGGYVQDYTESDVEKMINRYGAGANPASSQNKTNNKPSIRPLLRFGAEGAAASTGANSVKALAKLQVMESSSQSNTTDEPILCSLTECKRTTRIGCERNMCKKCCDRHHRSALLLLMHAPVNANDAPVAVSDTGNLHDHGVKELSMNERIAGLLEKVGGDGLLNTCAVHRTKPANQKNHNPSAILHCLAAQYNKLYNNDSKLDGVNGFSLSSRDVNQLLKEKQSHSEYPPNIDVGNPDKSSSKFATCSFSNPSYICSCKALLIGIGADEQMAGYGRHRTVYNTSQNSDTGKTDSSIGVKNQQPYSEQVEAESGDAHKWNALREEMNMDLDRLWKRNLGRDDRCVSDSGREAWFPYLDETVVEFLQQLPLSKIADLSLPQGVGDKKILRDAAKEIGLSRCTELVKRAIQFGTRIAQHTNQQVHGSNRKGKGTTQMD